MNNNYIDALKALSDPNRLRLFWLLLHLEQPGTVAETMDVTRDTQYNVSRNLKILHKAGLLTPHKKGKWVYYDLKEQTSAYCKALIQSVKLLPESDFEDVKKLCLLRLSMRVNGECIVGANSDEWLSIINKL